MDNNRIVFLDYLRVIACLMVMLVHSCEPFYLGGDGTLILNNIDAIWVTVVDSAVRSAVPLFMMASSFLLFPLKYDTTTFFKKRFKRVVIPCFIWLVLYALIPQYGATGPYIGGEISENFKHMALNFMPVCGHLWFVYMLLGVYIMMPILSPWIEKVSQRGEQKFLALWAFTTLIPFFRVIAQSIYGESRVWGEANWNEFGLFYGVSGFIGYLVLGHYFRSHVGDLSWAKTLLYAIPTFIAGYAISALGFWSLTPHTYPVSDVVDLAVKMELPWGFTTPGIALQTVAYFLIIRKFTSSGWFYQHVILPISKVTYGMYLMHIFYLGMYYTLLHAAFDCTPLVIFGTAICTYISSFVTAKIISYIPGIGKYIVG